MSCGVASVVDPTDERHIRACLELAARGRGATSPNPLVGSVVVADGDVVGAAYHRRVGEAHAERLALRDAGSAARGATLYTNMEPCCHHGRTPPCVAAILEAGVTRVVASTKDPDSRVDGKGFEALRDAGIDVTSGVLAEDAALLNAGYLTLKENGRPFVTAKAALSLDGRLATRSRQSQWITGAESRARAHVLRSFSDAVGVGVGTLLADDPRLTVRAVDAVGAGPGFRLVFDSLLRTPANARLLGEDRGTPTIVTTVGDGAAAEALRASGAELVVVPSAADGRIDLPAALRELGDRGVATLMIEGGGALLTAALDLGIIDKFVLFYAPLLIGGSESIPLWGGRGIDGLSDAPRLRRLRYEQLGEDWTVEGYLRLPAPPS